MAGRKLRLAITGASIGLCIAGAPRPAFGQVPSSGMPMPLVAPLFIENGAASSMITMVSNSAEPMDVNVVLSGASGTVLASTTVPLAAHGQEVIQVAKLLEGSVSSGERIGSVSLSTTGTNWSSLAAQMSIASQQQNGTPIYLEEEFLMLDGTGDNRYRAVGVSAVSPPALAIRNLATTPQNASITCIIEGGPATAVTIPMAAGEAIFARVCAGANPQALTGIEDAGTATFQAPKSVGVSVSGSGMPGTLAVYGVARGAAVYSALQFTQTSAARSGATVYAGIPVGSTPILGSGWFQPQAAVTNYGSTPTTVTVRLSTSPAGQPADTSTVATVSVPAQATITVPLPALNGDSAMRNSFVIASGSAPGQVYSSLRAIPAGGPSISVNLAGKDRDELENGGEHPWTIGTGMSSTLLLFNPDARQTHVVDMLVYTGPVQWVQHYDVAPGQTMAIGIDSLIRDQEPDSVGTKLPIAATSGVVLWSSPWRAGVFGRLVETNQSAELARSFSCSTKTTLCGAAQFTPAALSIAAGSSAYTLIDPPTCTGPATGGCATNPTHTFGSGSSYDWLSGNDSIATPPGAPFTRTGTFQGVAGGQTTFTGIAYDSYLCQASGGGAVDVIAAPAIMLNAANVTKKTTNVVVGQQIALTTSLQLPSGVSVSSQSWTVGGSPITGSAQPPGQAVSFCILLQVPPARRSTGRSPKAGSA